MVEKGSENTAERGPQPGPPPSTPLNYPLSGRSFIRNNKVRWGSMCAACDQPTSSWVVPRGLVCIPPLPPH